MKPDSYEKELLQLDEAGMIPLSQADVSEKKELMKEAGELMSQMKNMPGMKNMDKIFKSMNIPNNAKVNFGAMQQKFSEMTKQNNTKERMLKKLEKRKQSKQMPQQNSKQDKTYEEIQNEIDSIFKSFEADGLLNKTNDKPENKKKKKKKRKK